MPWTPMLKTTVIPREHAGGYLHDFLIFLRLRRVI
jgi:hypothetical protein